MLFSHRHHCFIYAHIKSRTVFVSPSLSSSLPVAITHIPHTFVSDTDSSARTVSCLLFFVITNIMITNGTHAVLAKDIHSHTSTKSTHTLATDFVVYCNFILCISFAYTFGECIALYTKIKRYANIIIVNEEEIARIARDRYANIFSSPLDSAHAKLLETSTKVFSNNSLPILSYHSIHKLSFCSSFSPMQIRTHISFSLPLPSVNASRIQISKRDIT